MRSIMASKTPQDSSFSFSRRYFHWKKKVDQDYDQQDDDQQTLNFTQDDNFNNLDHLDHNLDHFDHNLAVDHLAPAAVSRRRKKGGGLMSVSKLRSVLGLGTSNRFSSSRVLTRPGLGKTTRSIVGTLFGFRSGHVHIAFQEDPKLGPAFLVELATPTSFLVREMASGLVRIALECDKKIGKNKGFKLLDEPIWRTYCNGKKCGYAMRRECGPDEWKVFSSVGPITMGAGVLPEGGGGGGGEGELMYMRASFERIVGSKDSEAFYMMNPDNNGGPELSIYLIRV